MHDTKRRQKIGCRTTFRPVEIWLCRACNYVGRIDTVSYVGSSSESSLIITLFWPSLLVGPFLAAYNPKTRQDCRDSCIIIANVCTYGYHADRVHAGLTS